MKDNYFVYHYRSGIWLNGYIISHCTTPSTNQALEVLDGYLEHDFIPNTDYLAIVEVGDIKIIDVNLEEKGK